jgi:hypothetical protein
MAIITSDGNNWVEQAITEAINMITQPVELTGWDGVGYSVAKRDKEHCICLSSYGLRGGKDQAENLIKWIRENKDGLPVIRYYVSYGGASTVHQELYRLHMGVTVVAALIITGSTDGRPVPSVQEIQSNAPTMQMVREMCEKIAKDAVEVILLSPFLTVGREKGAKMMDHQMYLDIVDKQYPPHEYPEINAAAREDIANHIPNLVKSLIDSEADHRMKNASEYEKARYALGLWQFMLDKAQGNK